MSAWRLAIDFGTSNSAAAIRVDGQEPQTVRLTDAGDLMPSAVFADAGGLVVGVEALRRMMLDPGAFERNPKRLIGQPVVQLGDTDREVVDLVAAVLRTITRRAARVAGGGDPVELTLTHPAGFQRARRDVLVEAAERAGFQRSQIGLLPEPVAAVARYAQRAPLPPSGSHLCVVDVGGGTADVAVLRVTGHRSRPFEVVATAGRPDLGGGLFDLRLEDIVVEAVRTGGHDEVVAALEGAASLGARKALRDQVSQAKHALSESESTTVPVVTGAGTATVTVTAEEFAEAIADDVGQITALTVEACSRAKIAPTELAKLYLTGGASLVRPLQASIARVVGQSAATLDDPKLITCLGALSPLGQQLRERAAAPMPAPAPPKHVDLAKAPTPAPTPAPRPAPPAVQTSLAPAVAPTSAATSAKKKRGPLIAALIVAALLLVGGGVAVAAKALGGDPEPTGSPSESSGTKTTAATVAPPSLPCEDTDVSDDQCELLAELLADEPWLIDPEDCEDEPELIDAETAFNCPAKEDGSGFAPDGLTVYGYADETAMDSSFDNEIATHSLQEVELGMEPGWDTWGVGGRVAVYYSAENDRSLVAWTNPSTATQVWAGVDGEKVFDLGWWFRYALDYE
ncbi:MAG: Hsp70 family protein [Aeromicrobium sp.]|uniref:Hsp70 family protein n=1 Tax=Aeromicrobium sp. TaxID=1871063 RepID=UPI0039E3A723